MRRIISTPGAISRPTARCSPPSATSIPTRPGPRARHSPRLVHGHQEDARRGKARRGRHRDEAGHPPRTRRGRDRARVAAIVQKPFAPTWEDATAIVEAAKKAGVWLAVHENFRYQAPLRAIRKVIDSGAIGEPSWARIAFRTGFDVYRTQPYFYDEERFVIADVGVHVLDVARFLLGDVQRISCETQRRNPKVRAEDTATMLLRHESGAVSTVEVTYEARRADDAFPETLMEIEGPRGSIVVTAGCRMKLTSDGEATEHDIGAPLLSWTSHPWHVSQEGAMGACRHFLDCLQRGVPAETRGEDNLRTFALVDAAYRAAAEHRAVTPARWG